jgi:hypothetical protein
MAKREENFSTKKREENLTFPFFRENGKKLGWLFLGGFLVEDRVFGRIVKKI